MVTKRSTGLNLSSILTSSIVWGGLQCLNIYRGRLRDLTHQADSRQLDAIECLWLTNAHSFYNMFSTIGASWRLIDSCSANGVCWTNSRGCRGREIFLTEHSAYQIIHFTPSVLITTLWQHQRQARQNFRLQILNHICQQLVFQAFKICSLVVW